MNHTASKSKTPSIHSPKITKRNRSIRVTSKRSIRTANLISTPTTLSPSQLSIKKSSSVQKQQKRSLFGLFGSADRRVVYEPLNSFNPITLRSVVVPTAYKFPSYVLPSIDIVSSSSRQLVTPAHSEQCYIIDKTPKLLQLPSISAVTNDSKFVQVFAEATICVTNSLNFSLLGDTYVESLQSLVETATSNVVSYISEKDCLDKQYESFLVTNIHEDLQRLCNDVGVDVLKLVVIPTQLNLTNVAAQLQLIQTMNELSLAIDPNTQHEYDSQASQLTNPLHQMAQTNVQTRVDTADDGMRVHDAQTVTLLVEKLLQIDASSRNKLLQQLQDDAKVDTIQDIVPDASSLQNQGNGQRKEVKQ